MEAQRISLVLPVLLALALLTAPAVGDATGIYRWTAPDGTVTYGSNPPPDAEAERLRGAPGPASGSQPRVDPDAADGTAADQAEPAATAEPTGDTERDRQCATARQNLDVLENPAVRRIRTDSGETQVLTEEMREEMLREARDFYDEWCQ
ncbi:MAG: DUF4124 domain-containing protein [Ectothiorhodospiraceae bacterium]|nr:DUF4124 domain-containing protein [Ectothiorhodospiraceae bacterium]